MAFLPERDIERVVLHHPRIFALVFTIVILFVSILRASTLFQGQVAINTLAFVMLFSLPNGILEGYGIFWSIEKTLGRKLAIKDLAIVYSIFFFAAIFEVGFVHILLWPKMRETASVWLIQKQMLPLRCRTIEVNH